MVAMPSTVTRSTSVLLEVKVTAPVLVEFGLAITNSPSPKVFDMLSKARRSGIPFLTVRTRVVVAAA